MNNRILHVEDNPDDLMLMELAFRKAGADVRIETATDGNKAIQMLQNGLGTVPPACLLLDVKLPILSGLDVLAWIRNQPQLKRLPVIMVTSSFLRDDINRAYELGANSYLTKPSDLEALVGLARTIDLYWVRTNTRPELERNAKLEAQVPA